MDSSCQQKMQPSPVYSTADPESECNLTGAGTSKNEQPGNLFPDSQYPTMAACLLSSIFQQEFGHDGIDPPGPPLRTAHADQITTIHGDCADHAGAGHRRERGDLHFCGCGAAAASTVSRCFAPCGGVRHAEHGSVL